MARLKLIMFSEELLIKTQKISRHFLKKKEKNQCSLENLNKKVKILNIKKKWLQLKMEVSTLD